MYVIISAIGFAFFVISLIDVIRAPSANFLPKFGWIIVVILLPFLGAILWWAIGREWETRQPASSAFPDRVVRATAPPQRPRDIRTTEQQLADLEREEKEERLRAELARKRREKGLE